MKPKILQRVDELESEVANNASKTSQLINFNSFGLLTDSVMDQSNVIQNIINYAQDNKIKLTFPIGTYRVSKSIFIDGIIDIDFSWSEIVPIGSASNFTNGFVFLVNSTDGITRTKVMFRYGLLEKIKFNNTSNIQNLKAIFIACNYHVQRAKFFDMLNDIVIAGYYLDDLEINDIYTSSINNGDYCIKQNVSVDNMDNLSTASGDSWDIYNLEAPADTTYEPKLIYLVGFNHAVNIRNIINGVIELKNVNANIDSFYCEVGGLIVENARVKLTNSLIHYTGIRFPIYLKTSSIGASKQVEIENVLFSYPSWRDSPNNFNIDDKNILIDEDFKSNITMKNCKRGIAATGLTTYHGCKVKLNNKTTGEYDSSNLSNYFSLTSQFLIFNAKKILNNGKIYFLPPQVNTTTIEYVDTNTLGDNVYYDYSTSPKTTKLGMQFKNASGTYYYRPIVYVDYTRKIGMDSGEKSLVIDSTLRKVPVIKLDSNYNYINYKLHVLVGTVSNSYTKHALLNVIDNGSSYYIDGPTVNGQQLYSTSMVAPTLNYYSSVEIDINTGNVICVGSATPTIGTWSVGDIVIINGIKWTCTIAGTPGTWTQV